MQTVTLDHDKVNFTYSTDWHLSAIAPGRRADDYLTAILGKLEFLSNLTHRIGGISLCGGDVCHIKSARHAANSISMLGKLLCALRMFPTGKVYGTIGNHDLGYGERMDSVPHQPIGLLIASGAYHDLSNEPVMFVNNTPHQSLMIPTVRVHVESFPFGGAETTLKRIMASRRHPDATHHVGIVHAYGAPGDRGSLFGEQTIGYDEVAESDFDYLLWGHDHSRIETVKVGNVTDIHLGSLARAALDHDQTDRPVSAAILSFSDKGVIYKEIKVPVKPLAEVFVVADRGVRKVEKSEEMKEFFTKMEETVEGVETADPAEALSLLCQDDPPLLALAKELCGM